MNYCSKCNIAFEERKCPLCEAKDELKSLEERIVELEREE